MDIYNFTEFAELKPTKPSSGELKLTWLKEGKQVTTIYALDLSSYAFIKNPDTVGLSGRIKAIVHTATEEP